MKVDKAWIVIIGLMVLSVCQCGRKTTTVPADLIGVWETTAPDYADRSFEIKADQVLFETGEGKFDTYPITEIKTEKGREELKTLYLICYKNAHRQEYKLFFYYDPANQGTIRLKNQFQIVWTKKALSPASD